MAEAFINQQVESTHDLKEFGQPFLNLINSLVPGIAPSDIALEKLVLAAEKEPLLAKTLTSITNLVENFPPGSFTVIGGSVGFFLGLAVGIDTQSTGKGVLKTTLIGAGVGAALGFGLDIAIANHNYSIPWTL